LARRRKTILDAVKTRAIDRGSLDAAIIGGADLVVLATPVKTVIDIIPRLRKYLKKGCIVTDVGSCKKTIVASLEKKMPKGVCFVGSHPLAGSEKKGVDFARADLFKDTLCVITPTRKTNPSAVKRLKNLWVSLDAKVETMNPEIHDKALAYLSHLPHILAFSLIQAIPAGSLRFAPRSLKDTTRIASSDPLVWQEIFLMNSANIGKAVSDFQRHLAGLKKMLARRNGPGILRILKQAKTKRDLI
jgi:prephenate dehydrogenase